MQNKYIKKWKVPSFSDPSKEYVVSLTTEGHFVCSCWAFLKTRKPCKHINSVLEKQQRNPISLSLQDVLELAFKTKLS